MATGKLFCRTKVNMRRRHTKKRGTRRHRKMKGGFYSFNGGLGPGAPSWGKGSEMGGYAVDKGGNMSNMGPNGMRPEIQYGRGRRRKSKGRKTRRRMRGGGKYGGVSASFEGSGSRGMANYAGVNTRVPPLGGSAYGGFNDAAAASMRAGNSFDILPK
jgi:hypothetical protein